MKLLFSIIINAGILYAITYFLSGNNDLGIQSGIVLGCDDCSYTSLAALKTYILGGIILGGLNIVIRPILKILSLPLYFIFLGLASLIVNGVILYLFGTIINSILIIPDVGYEIQGGINFIIAVAIFTVLNTLYSLLFFKK